jgi:hypothetical protein
MSNVIVARPGTVFVQKLATRECHEDVTTPEELTDQTAMDGYGL